MLTLREVTEQTGLKRSRLMQLIGEGDLRAEKRLSKVGGAQLFVSETELQRFIRQREEAARQRSSRGGRPPKLPPRSQAS